MVKLKTNLWLSLLVSVLIVISQFSGTFSIIDTNQIFNEPRFNTISCTQDDSFVGHVEDFIGGREYIYECPRSINTNNFFDAPECDIYFQVNSPLKFGGAKFYKIDLTGFESEIDENIISFGTDRNFITSIKSGEKIRITMRTSVISFFNRINKEDITLRSEFDAFHLVERGTNVGEIVLSKDCFITRNVDRNKLLKTCSGSGCVQEGYPDKLGYGKSINYVAGWFLSPVEGSTEIYKGENVFCSNYQNKYALYKLKDVETLSGINKVVDFNNIIKTVDCCASSPFCNNNFETIKSSEEIQGSGCSIFNPAPQGWFNHPTEFGKVVTYKCLNGVVTIEESKTNNCLNCDGVCTSDYECVSAEPPIAGTQPKPTTDYQGLILLGLIAFIITFMFVLIIGSIIINKK